jgi:hypothetical protein
MNTENMWLILNDFLKNKAIRFYKDILSVNYSFVSGNFEILLINKNYEQVEQDDFNKIYFNTIREVFIVNNFNKRESFCFIFDNKKEEVESFLFNDYKEKNSISDSGGFEINTSSLDDPLSSKVTVDKSRKKKSKRKEL